MKRGLVLSGIIVFLISTVYAGEEEENYVKLLNGRRARIAETLGIANMHKLTYCYNLEKLAISLPNEDHPNYRTYMVLPKNDTEKDWERRIENELFNYSRIEIFITSEREQFELNPLEIFLPFQTKIGCENRKISRRNRDGQVLEYLGFCLLGPATTFESWKTAEGAPGSRCGDLEVEDGLCVPVGDQCELNWSTLDIIEYIDSIDPNIILLILSALLTISIVICCFIC